MHTTENAIKAHVFKIPADEGFYEDVVGMWEADIYVGDPLWDSGAFPTWREALDFALGVIEEMRS